MTVLGVYEHLKILVVEDNPGDALLIEEMLKGESRFDVEFKKVETLNRALIALIDEGYDLVLLDLGLPDSKGLETFTTLHARTTDVPVIVLTGLADEELGIRAIKHGAQDYLVKGQIDGKLLSRSILYSIERFRLERELKKKVDEIENLNRMLRYWADTEVEQLKKQIKELKKG